MQHRAQLAFGIMKGVFQSSVWQTLFFASALPGMVVGTEQNDVCTTAECVRSAAHVLGNFDPKYTEIDPCEDFDQCKSSHKYYSIDYR